MIEPGVDVLLFGIIGLLAGAHCIGMCGPLVTFYDSRLRSDHSFAVRSGNQPLTPFIVWQHTLFNLGRVVSYTAIGALLGAVGGRVFGTLGDLVASGQFIRGVVGIGIGTIVIVIGLSYFRGGTGIDHSFPGVGRITRAVVGVVDRLVSGPGIVGLGAIHGLLPCPILFPAYLFAFASGSAVTGGIALAALGVGTIPAVLLFGTVIDAVDPVHRQRVHRVLGLAFLVLGYVLLAHGLMGIGIDVPHPGLPHWDPLQPSTDHH